MTFLLEARGISLERGGVPILSGISLGLHPGEFGVLLGPSGSGKSSLLKCLSGMVAPDDGKVLLAGRDLGDFTPGQLSRAIGSVPQDDIIHTELRLADALRYAAQLRLPAGTPPAEVEAAVARVLEATELSGRADVRIRRLSGGQRKRASMGVELLLAPPVLLLDEPTSGLDPALEQSTMQLLARLAREGRAVLTTTHSTASLELADFVVLVVQGFLAWAGPLAPALEHFGVPDPDLIFKRVRDGRASEWAARYRQSPWAARMSGRPAPERAA